jgi:ribosomal-protein-alanine N-acetyltransferase
MMDMAEIVEFKQCLLDEVLEIEADCFTEPWTRAMFDVYPNENTKFIVIKEKGKTAGYCLLQFSFDTAELLRLAVHSRFRRRGLGEALIKTLIEFSENVGLKEIFLEVDAQNLAARHLYSKLGFNQIGKRRHYYKEGHDALVLRKII